MQPFTQSNERLYTCVCTLSCIPYGRQAESYSMFDYPLKQWRGVARAQQQPLLAGVVAFRVESLHSAAGRYRVRLGGSLI